MESSFAQATALLALPYVKILKCSSQIIPTMVTGTYDVGITLATMKS
jgi:hypothetical protein